MASLSSDKLLRAVRYFREVLNSTQPPLQHLEMFLAVAEDEGIGQIALEKKLDSLQATTSRNIKRLSQNPVRDDDGKMVRMGHDLLEVRPTAGVFNGVYLSKHGKEVFLEIQKILGKG